MNAFRDAESSRDAVASTAPGRRDFRRRGSHPQGWEPGLEWNGDRGTITTQPFDAEPNEAVWRELIADWGLDPDLVELVDGSIQFRGWDANVSEGRGKDKVTSIRRMKYYRATIQLRHDIRNRADVEELIRYVKRRKPGKKPRAVATERALVVGLSDWQLGKGEGDGSDGTMRRILNSLDRLVQHVQEMIALGRAPSVIYLCGLGDIVEQCEGHYPMQAFQADLDRREQMKLARMLLLAHVDALLELVPRIVLVAVPGNHGENRKDGKAFTTFTDNDDLAVFDGIQETMEANPERYGHVSVLIADQLATTVDMAGVVVGLAHMHQGRKGGNPQQKVMNWWAGQALGRTENGIWDADILFTGHYHHLMVDESCGRTWFQLPAQDPGSRWFTESTGQHSPPGLLAVGVGECYGDRLWGDLALL